MRSPATPQRFPLMISPATDTRAYNSPLYLRECGTDNASEDGAETYIKDNICIFTDLYCIFRLHTLKPQFT